MTRLAAIAICCIVANVPAQATEFDAAIGKTGYGRCHMDSCGFFVIDAAVPIGSSNDGILFVISTHDWSADYRSHGESDEHEYDRPPVSVSKPTPRVSMVFCSKTKPAILDFYDNKWVSSPLRPGDENAVFGFNESGYQFYYAACHHFITRDPISKNMALKLGYKFANEHAKDGDTDQHDVRPMDLLK